jgi:hypothetical protein
MIPKYTVITASIIIINKVQFSVFNVRFEDRLRAKSGDEQWAIMWPRQTAVRVGLMTALADVLFLYN